jgi:hopanoid-associated phosphorylase
MVDAFTRSSRRLSVSSSPSLLVITGMAREVKLAAGPGVETIASGGSAAQLRNALRARHRSTCGVVLSFGVAGGLDPELKPGAVVVATGVWEGDQRWPAQARTSARMVELLRDSGFPVATADLAGVDLAVLGAEAKATLRAQTGAAAVDMESHIAAAHAAEHGIPFAAIRAVCDPAERSLPPWIAAALRPDGGTDVPAILRHLLAQPTDLPQLVRLARDANAAFASLRGCRDLLGIGRGGPDLVELGSDVA